MTRNMVSDMICGIRIGSRNYYYTMEGDNIGPLLTYNEMARIIERNSWLHGRITDEALDDEWDATDDFRVD